MKEMRFYCCIVRVNKKVDLFYMHKKDYLLEMCAFFYFYIIIVCLYFLYICVFKFFKY